MTAPTPTKPMKIALLNVTAALKRGGVENKTWQVANHLLYRGHDVTLFTGKGEVRNPVADVPLKIVQLPAIPSSWTPPRPRHGWLGKGPTRLSHGMVALRPLIKGKFDAILTYKPYDLPAAFLVRRLTGAKVVNYSGGGEHIVGLKAMSRRLDAWFTVSRFDVEEMDEVIGLKPVPNPNGIDASIFRPIPRDERLAQELNIPAEAPVIVTTARFVGFKRHDVALEAFAKVRQQLPDARYILIGSGPLESQVRAQVEQLGLTSAVTFFGDASHPQLARLYSLADVSMLTSETETQGMAVAEGGACGCAMVVSRTGGLIDFVVDGGGTLVEPGDVDGFAAGALKYLQDAGLRDAHGQRGREHVLGQFNWARNAAITEKNIQQPGLWLSDPAEAVRLDRELVSHEDWLGRIS